MTDTIGTTSLSSPPRGDGEKAPPLLPADLLPKLIEFQERILLTHDADLVLRLLDRELRTLFEVDFLGAFLVQEQTHQFGLDFVSPEQARELCEVEAQMLIKAGVFASALQQETAMLLTPQSATLRAQGQRRLAVAPLTCSNKTLGMVLVLLSPQTEPLVEGRLAVIQFLCRDAGLAIEDASFYESITRQNEALQRAERDLFCSKQQIERQNRDLEEHIRQATASLQTAYRDLHLETTRLESTILSVGEGLIVTDNAGRIAVVNAPAERLLGIGREALLDSSALEAPLPERLRDTLRAMLEAMSAQREPGIQRIGFRVGTTACRATLSPVGSRGRFGGTVLVLHDVTQEEKLSQTKDQFLSHVSHEMRTPLTSIRLFARLVVDGQADAAQQKEFVSIILGESERLGSLIDSLLDLAKIRSGKVEWKHAPVRMDDVALAVAKTTYSLAEHKQIRLNTEAAPNLPSVMGDRDRLYEVVLNLVSNAIKFSPPATHVSIRIEQLAEGIQTSVSDQGPGIPSDRLDSIFNEFVQLDSAQVPGQKGSGLGLSISREIVSCHGGRIWAESTMGRGATFRFIIPVAEPMDSVATAAPVAAVTPHQMLEPVTPPPE